MLHSETDLLFIGYVIYAKIFQYNRYLFIMSLALFCIGVAQCTCCIVVHRFMNGNNTDKWRNKCKRMNEKEKETEEK